MNQLYGLFRWAYHMWIGPMHVRDAFSKADFMAIEQAIAEGEQRHRAEIRFAVESSLGSMELWNGELARGRALDVFSHFRIWDTEDNNGVLIYLLWADHAVEIIADRGADERVDEQVWTHACQYITEGCSSKRPVQGVLEAIALINDALAVAFPLSGDRPNVNELPNTPMILR
jgi:uncharacterized membrane protein